MIRLTVTIMIVFTTRGFSKNAFSFCCTGFAFDGSDALYMACACGSDKALLGHYVSDFSNAAKPLR